MGASEMLEGMKFVLCMGWKKVVIETDCQKLVEDPPKIMTDGSKLATICMTISYVYLQDYKFWLLFFPLCN